jgi:hypothetical protein
VPWNYKPKPENIMVKPEIHDRVVTLAREDLIKGVRLLREETGLPLTFASVLVKHWLEER